MALFQIMDNDSVAASVPRKATEEEKIGNNLQDCQAVMIMTDQKETGRDSNQEDKVAEDTGKEGFEVNGESGLDDTEVCASGSNKGETGEDKSSNEMGVKGKSCLDRTKDTVRLNMQHFEAGSTSSNRSKPEQVVRFEGLEFIGDADGGSPSDSTTDDGGSPTDSTSDDGGSPTDSEPETSSMAEELIAKLKGLWLQCRNVFIAITTIIITITLPKNQPKDALLSVT